MYFKNFDINHEFRRSFLKFLVINCDEVLRKFICL
jgi:hypothetical protein